MKFDIPRKEFFEAVSATALAAPSRTSVGILQNLKIEATDHGVRIIGCDGEMWIERTVPCGVSEPGSICVPAKFLNQLVGSLPDGEVQLRTLEGQGVMLQQGASEYRMMSLDALDFPEPPDYDGNESLTLKMSMLRNAVDSVLFAVSTDTHRQSITGVLFTYNGSTLTLVATDTHRLAVRRIHQEGIGSSINAVVPDKALKAIKSLPVAEDEPVKIQFGAGRLGVEAPGARVISQLLAGTFPNWERVVPSETTRRWSVEVDQLLEKVKRTIILASDNAYRVRFKGDGDQILLSARSDEKGEAKEEVPMISSDGDVEIAFNGKFVQDFLEAVSGPGVTVEMTESSRPAIFRPADDNGEYLCVIMPMALG